MSMGFSRSCSIFEEDETRSSTPSIIDIQEKNTGNPWSDSADEQLYYSSRSSSTQSWIDEYEISATKELQEQYDQFEAALYSEESAAGLPKSLQDEVKIWSEHSPHIRVNGIKVNLKDRPDISPEEEEYDNDYEEVFASHGSLEDSLEKSLLFSEDLKGVIGHCDSGDQKIIKDDLKNAIVGKLFEQAWPKVLEKFEPVIKSVSAGRNKTARESLNKSAKILENVQRIEERKSTIRSNSSRSHVREINTRKPFVDSSTEHLCVLSSHGLRSKNYEPPDTFRSIHYSSNGVLEPVMGRTESFNARKRNSQSSVSTTNLDKRKVAHKEASKVISLPPIEALAITPRAPDKRSVSAMVRFTKTLPRVRPITSKNDMKIVVSSSMENKSSNLQKKCLLSERKRNDFSDPDLQVIGTRSATIIKNNKWRY